MTPEPDEEVARPTAIVATEETWAAAEFFNPNEWEGPSKGLIQSCAGEYSLLLGGRAQIQAASRNAKALTTRHVKVLQDQWRTARFDPAFAVWYAEVPSVHIAVEAFLAGTKTLLDLLAQLIQTERVVDTSIHGFHQSGDRVLNALRNNATATKKEMAQVLIGVIERHKVAWINRAIMARDQLIHPSAGKSQLMFRLRLSEQAWGLRCDQVVPPVIDSQPAGDYAAELMTHIERFVREYLGVFPPLPL